MGNSKRIKREARTICLMIALYCGKSQLQLEICPDCARVRDYALERLQWCPFGEGKTTCAKCPVHCYRSDMRQKIRKVMRYSGSRILYRHPLLALQHLVDGLRGKLLKRGENR